MSFLPDPAILLFLFSIAAILFALCWFFSSIHRRRRIEKIRARARFIIAQITDISKGKNIRIRPYIRFIKRRKWFFLEQYGHICDTVNIPETRRQAVQALLARCRLDIRLLRDLKSSNIYVCCRAVVSLSLFPSRSVLLPLVQTIELKKSHPLRLILASTLADLGVSVAIPTIIDTLKGSPVRYQRAIWGILSGFEGGLNEFIPLLIGRKEKEIQMLLIHLAGRDCPLQLLKHLEKLTSAPDLDIAHEAFRVFSKIQAEKLDHRTYLEHDDFLIRNLAAESLSRVPRTSSLALLFDYINDPVIRKSACLAITSLIRARPHFLKIVMHRFLNDQRTQARIVLADILANYVDYLMGKTLRQEAEMIEKIFFELVKQGKTRDIINFLNRNADKAIEQRLVSILRHILKESPDKSAEFRKYLNKRILGELDLEITDMTIERPGRRERHNLPLLIIFLISGAVLPPAACLVLAGLSDPEGIIGFLRTFVRYFNTIFAVYASALSAVYMFIFLFSLLGVRRQVRIQALTRPSLLFKDNILPSISIISPAYNEEATIVESVHSLFHLRYPDYEIIVVNDGSTDKTMEKLIDAFELERTDIFVHGYLHTQEIRAIYANKRYPELLVIDKMNGGKADSLNAGINVARKEYFSGIDADSLLERDALLNLAVLFIFSEHTVTAAGGNIFPANGCTVSKGELINTRIPAKHLARFQTLEYLRSFMAGRVGWSELRLLLIISGAFGVFHRRTVINTGGYLTQSSRYQKDTVGEDMELVVRLCRSMRESKIPFSMVYAYNANCWTEIPERFPILVNQRDRWQRGLLDIVTYHSRLLFNPAYGRVGIFGFPYFLIFEILGPWLEVEGFLVFIASLFSGWVTLSIVALVLMATVGLGLCMSIFSITIAEYSREYFPLRDKLKLFLYAFIENFGVRQILNALRARGLIRMIGRTEGWGKMERRGWNSGKTDPGEAINEKKH